MSDPNELANAMKELQVDDNGTPVQQKGESAADFMERVVNCFRENRWEALKNEMELSELRERVKVLYIFMK